MLRIINKIVSIKLPYILLLLSLIISLFCFKLYRWDGNNGSNKETIISSDGLGYYNYLPAIFINDNLNNLTYNATFTNSVDGRVVNKYFVGTALLQAPFFMIAHAVAINSSYESDGFSAPYQFMVSMAALFYLFIGLIALLKLLKLYRISDFNSGIAVLLIFFGTNLFYYSVIAGSMSHVYSFSAITCFALMIKKLLGTGRLKFLYSASFLYALIILIRPTNGIVILLPLVLSNNKTELLNLGIVLFKKWYRLVLAIFIFVSTLSIQFFMWHEQSGDFIIWSYSDEGFYFFNPEVINVLLSYKKGLFIYTPITFISLFGLKGLFKRNKYQFFMLLSFLAILTYIISSWWNWYYGDSFGLRTFIDYYFIFGVLLGVLLERNKVGVRRIFLFLTFIFFVVLNMLQSYQYYRGIIHVNNMNSEKYWHVFLKTTDEHINSLGGNMDIEPFSKKNKKLIYSTINDFESMMSNWENGSVMQEEICNAEEVSSTYSKYGSNEFGATFKIQNDSLLFNSKRIFVKASLRKLELDNTNLSNVLFVVQVKNKDNKNQYYYRFKVNEINAKQLCKWQKYNYTFVLPKLENLDDQITIYLWNRDHENFIIDDFKLNFYRIY
jgi:hypothetical protein